MPPASESDREALRVFLTDLEEELEWLLRDEEARGVLWIGEDPELRLEIPPVEITAIDHMRESWWEIQRQFELARKLLESSAYDDLLGAVGCSGYQLRTKIATFQQARDTYARVKVSEPRVRERGGGFFSWLRRSFLKPVLKGANALLGSVAKVLPPAEMIKEFKESGEAIAEVSDALKEAHDEGIL